jgi:hypothetical protein
VTALRRIELALAQGASAHRAIRSAGISSAAYYRWRAEYGGMNAEQVQRVIELKKENARLQERVEKLSQVIVRNPNTSAALRDDVAGPSRSAAEQSVPPRGAPKPAKQ